jgi:5-methylcytosine-specific restriction endonuclease McrA
MRTLILNKAWIAIGNISWKDAFRLLCAERAVVLEYYDATVKTSREEMFIPAVILLLNFDKVPKCKVSYSKRAILERDDYRCQYCSKVLSIGNATLDHVIPRAIGGKTTFENTVASCHPCNNKKGDRLLGCNGFNLKKKPCKPDKAFFRLRLKSLQEEWKNYLPEKLINEFQTYYRNKR